MKLVTIIGARPQFIKAAAFSRAVSKESNIEEILVHTGQHFDSNMSDIFFEELEIPKPKYNLGISGGSHALMTGSMMIQVEKVLVEEKPDAVLVYGDTNSTMAAALSAVKLHIPIIHVEAGIRMGTLDNPEEVNRIVTDHISSMLFTPTELELQQLKNEGVTKNVFAVGNIMYDSYIYATSKIANNYDIWLENFDGEKIRVPSKYYYMTCHRQENTYTDEPLREILSAMNSLEYPTIYPVHPRNQERASKLCRNGTFTNVILVKPVGYFEAVALLKNCEKVVTDSGGLQCEAFYAQKQCITVLDNAVWPQTMVGNRNQLSKPLVNEIVEKLNTQQVIDEDYKPFGDGNTALRVLDILKEKVIESCID